MSQIHVPATHTIEESVLAAAAALLLVLAVTFLINLRFKINYDRRWKELQKLLSQKENWKDAVLEADKMLDSVLKSMHYKGKTMGERLVSAQHEISANDMVWFSHKLANKIKGEGLKPTKAEVKKSLLGFWRAMKDLGALGGKEEKAVKDEPK